MSNTFYVEVEKVGAVLLADGWHEVAGGSFSLVSYKFLEGRTAIGEQRDGFTFRTEDGSVVTGLLTSILAVKHTSSR